MQLTRPLVLPDGSLRLVASVSNSPPLLGPIYHGLIDVLPVSKDGDIEPPAMPLKHQLVVTGDLTGATVSVDGKLVLGGGTQFGPVVLRYNTNGTLDHSFGDNGQFLEDRGPSTSNAATVIAAADGTTIFWSSDSDIDGDGIAVRLGRVLRNGQLDATYPKNIYADWGIVTDESDSGRVQLLGNGWVAVTYNQNDYDQTMGVLVRPDGSTQEIFPVPPFPIPGFYGGVNRAVEQIRPVGNTGKIAYTATAESGLDGHTASILVRLNPDKRYDTTFDGKGFIVGRYDMVDTQPDGGVLYRSEFGLKRLNSAGKKDASFGTNGIAAVGYANFARTAPVTSSPGKSAKTAMFKSPASPATANPTNPSAAMDR